MLSVYQSPVECSSRKVEENFPYNVNYRYYFHLQTWKLYKYLKALDGLPSQVQGNGRILRIAYFSEKDIRTDDWQCRYIVRMSY